MHLSDATTLYKVTQVSLAPLKSRLILATPVCEHLHQRRGAGSMNDYDFAEHGLALSEGYALDVCISRLLAVLLTSADPE